VPEDGSGDEANPNEESKGPGGKKKKKKNKKKKPAENTESATAEDVDKEATADKLTENKHATPVETGTSNVKMADQSTPSNGRDAHEANVAAELGQANPADSLGSQVPTEEELKEALKYQRAKEDEAIRIRNYQHQLKEADPENFRDRPDPINSVRLMQSFNNSLIIEWDMPCSNNEEIVLYNIYISERREARDIDMLH